MFRHASGHTLSTVLAAVCLLLVGVGPPDTASADTSSTFRASPAPSPAYSSSADLRSPFPAAHDFHVSYTRLAVEGNFAVCNIRFFKDDLREVLESRLDSDTFLLDASPQTDASFLAYLSEHFVLSVDQDTLAGSIIGSGEDIEGKEEIWWYTIQFEAKSPIGAFLLTNDLLVEHFSDQKNIVKIQHFPSEKTLSYYFDNKDTAFDIEL